MKKLTIFLMIFTTVAFFTYGMSKEQDTTKVKIETEFGAIKIKLYNETPLHRDNFIKLVKDSFYTNLLFHRVIQGFMIQGGDPESKNAEPGTVVIVCFPAFIKSASSSPSYGNGPIPNNPFSD